MNDADNVDDMVDDEFSPLSRDEIKRICEELVAMGKLRKFIGEDGQVRYIATEFTAQPDFALLAQACGCCGENVTRPEEVRGALERALRANAEGQPAVIAFAVDGETYAEGFHAYYALKDG